jgi:hypothetical protein
VVRAAWLVGGALLLFLTLIGPGFLMFLVLLWFGVGMVTSAVYMIATGTGNKLVLACWAAIVPIAIVHFIYPITGWPMFGYRYALDYYPFMLLLAWVGMRDNVSWHVALLIGASILVSGAGVLWINIFEVREVWWEPGTLIRWVNW